MSSPSAPAPSPVADDLWPDISRHALALAETLRAIAPRQPPKTQAACLSYANFVDEIARLSSARGAVPPAGRLTPALTLKQMQDFGRLLRDKRNQAGFSRVQLARKAKLSDATIKFVETARHPPSRATLLRLVGVVRAAFASELGVVVLPTPALATPFARFAQELTSMSPTPGRPAPARRCSAGW